MGKAQPTSVEIRIHQEEVLKECRKKYGFFQRPMDYMNYINQECNRTSPHGIPTDRVYFNFKNGIKPDEPFSIYTKA